MADFISKYNSGLDLENDIASKATKTSVDADLAEKINIADVVDNLISTDINKPLSANQGKTLKNYVDNILISGSNANGTYLKFSDGTMICRIRRTVTDQAINTAYGSNYLGYRTWTFPIAFLDTTDLAITIGEAKWGTGAGWTGGASAVTATTCQLNFFESYSRASGTAFTYSALAIGRWK